MTTEERIQNAVRAYKTAPDEERQAALRAIRTKAEMREVLERLGFGRAHRELLGISF